MEQKKDQPILPEEKLLKVIQGAKAGGQKPVAAETPAAAAPAKPAATTAPSPVPAQAKSAVPSPAPSPAKPATVTAPVAGKAPAKPAPMTKEKPALKVAVQPPAEAQEKPAPVKSQKAAPTRADAARVPVVRRSGRIRLSLSLFNRLLGAAAAVFLLLTGADIVSAIRAPGGAPGGAVIGPSSPENAGAAFQTPLTNGLESVDKDLVILNPPPEGGGGRPDPTNRVPWQIYVGENVKLKGRSGSLEDPLREAILFDKKLNKLHVCTLGRKFTVAEQEVTVTAIGDEDAVLSDGKHSLTLK